MIVLGRITAPYGVRGWVRIHPFADDPAGWCGMSRWWLGTGVPHRDWSPCEVQECRAHGGGLIAHLAGVSDRSAAERLKGMLVAAPRDLLPGTGEGEYYWADLIGMSVENEAGEALGTVADLIRAGAHEVLAVRDASGGERLLPFVEDVVRMVDGAAGVIRVAWQKDW